MAELVHIYMESRAFKNDQGRAVTVMQQRHESYSKENIFARLTLMTDGCDIFLLWGFIRFLVLQNTVFL